MRTPDWQTEDGRIRLWCADCLDILPEIEPGSVDAVVTDPPYEITASGGGIGATRKYLNDTEGFTDCGFDYGILSRFPNWMCFGTLRQVPKLIEAAGVRRWMLITWNKPNPCPLVCGNYLPDTEYIVHAWSRGGLHGDASDKRRYFLHPLGDKQHGEHPNEKPLTLMEKLLRTATPRGGLCCDPFMGSGTTGVACVRLGRRFIGVEKERKYFDIACQRIEAELNRLRLFEPAPKVVQRSLLGDAT